MSIDAPAPTPDAFSDAERQKCDSILQACKSHDVPLLREFAVSRGGFINDQVRQSAWPILLGCQSDSDQANYDTKSLPPHKEESQVQLDVDRSFVYDPEAETESIRSTRKAELSQVINQVLRRHPMLHYFQGYHDIVQVILLVLGIDAASPAVASLSLLRIRDFMLPTMSGTVPHLRLLPPILRAADPVLANHLSHTQPFFALPATLTLYAHEIEEFGSIARLFDFLLASEAVVPIYLFTAIIISRKDKLLEIDADEPEMLHSVLSRLPQPLDLESLIEKTTQLFEQHPPERLPGRSWTRISSNSVLKTTRHFEQMLQQTLQDGERFFAQQAKEVRRQEALQLRLREFQSLARRYRRPATYTGMALFVAAVALVLRGSSSIETVQRFSTAVLGMRESIWELWTRIAAKL